MTFVFHSEHFARGNEPAMAGKQRLSIVAYAVQRVGRAPVICLAGSTDDAGAEKGGRGHTG